MSLVENGPNSLRHNPVLVPESPSEFLPIPLKSRKIRKLERRFGLPGETFGDILERMYVDEAKSFIDIAHEFDSDNRAVSRWILKYRPEIIIGDRAKELAEIRKEKREGLKKKLYPLRSAKLKEYAANNPDKFAELARKGKITLKKMYTARKREILGHAPKKALKKLNRKFPPQEIAEKLNRKLQAKGNHHRVSKEAVVRWLKEYRIKPKKNTRRKGLSPEEIEARRTLVRKAEETGAIEFLSPNEQKVILTIYPKKGRSPQQADVARGMGKTRERIRQLEKKAIEKIEKLFQGKGEEVVVYSTNRSTAS